MGVDFDKALEFTKLTKGYAYAYQLLGDLLYRTDKKEITEEILQSFDSALEDNVYNKIWSSLSKNQKTICYALFSLNKKEVKELIDLTGFSNSMIQVYKKRMYLVGILDLSTRGKIDFSLPRFKEFVKFQKALEE